jgi:ubiquitin carboxyl-terminal hydrolase 2
MYNDKCGGLANLGNTCYLNTAIQCLGYCEPFLKMLMTKSDESTNAKTLHTEFASLCNLLFVQGKSIIPKRFIKVIKRALGNALIIEEENDIQEFIAIFMDKLNASMAPKVPIDLAFFEKQTQSTTGIDRFHAQARQNWMADHKLAYSHVVDLFYGQQVNQIKCDACNKNAHIFGTFSSIMISFEQDPRNQENTEQTVGKLIANTLKRETIDMRECDFCKQKAKGHSIQRFNHLSDILTVNIKRFAPDGTQKDTRPLHVPEYLDLSETVIFPAQGETFNYRLASIACHIGSIHNGHYFAICRHPTSNAWFLIDDDDVKPIEHYSKIKSSLYYALFYTKTI